MLKIAILSFTLFVFASADTIDKKKILEIIKAAKQYKSVPIANKTEATKKKITSSQPIVYSKKNTSIKASLMKIDYGSLPLLPPSSLELKRKFLEEQQQSARANIHFKTPVQNRDKIANTQARRIKFF